MEKHESLTFEKVVIGITGLGISVFCLVADRAIYIGLVTVIAGLYAYLMHVDRQRDKLLSRDKEIEELQQKMKRVTDDITFIKGDIKKW